MSKARQLRLKEKRQRRKQQVELQPFDQDEYFYFIKYDSYMKCRVKKALNKIDWSYDKVLCSKELFALKKLIITFISLFKTNNCSINDFKHFSVIHGKGDGILQKAVWDFLKKYPHVENFYFARPENGGTGKTFVDLK